MNGGAGKNPFYFIRDLCLLAANGAGGEERGGCCLKELSKNADPYHNAARARKPFRQRRSSSASMAIYKKGENVKLSKSTSKGEQ